MAYAFRLLRLNCPALAPDERLEFFLGNAILEIYAIFISYLGYYIMNEPVPYKKLHRSRKERMIAGVCGGLAEYFHIDPTIVRLIFILFFFAGGAAFLAYIILWLIVPLDENA